MSRYVIGLDDVTPNRATVTAVAPLARGALVEVRFRHYAIVTDPALVPELDERVWIRRGGSTGEHTIIARGTS